MKKFIQFLRCLFRRGNTQRYVAGFMFSGGLAYVALIRKQKPAWQRGKLNGVGGKIERGEYPLEAMIREFREETGAETSRVQWCHYCRMGGDNGNGGKFTVDFFACTGDLFQLKTTTDEKVEHFLVSEIVQSPPDVIENLPWLIASAIDHLQDRRPSFITANY